jgi:hypothetical protein
MARTVAHPAPIELVDYVQDIHEHWDGGSSEETDILAIIYQIYKFGVPMDIHLNVSRDLKATFGADHPICQLIKEMVYITHDHFTQYRDEEDPSIDVYSEYLAADIYREVKLWMAKWEPLLIGMKKSFKASIVDKYTGSMLYSLTNIQLRV